MSIHNDLEGILLIDKPKGKTSFSLVAILRRLIGVQKIGHAGTLDPLATGVMVLLVGKNFTRQSDRFLSADKEYRGILKLGEATDSYDAEGALTESSDKIPSLEEIQKALSLFQGEVWQTPPMFSAKKIAGKKLYELARKGIEVERAPVKVFMKIILESYTYPHLHLHITCSKGTYIRSLAHDLGKQLGCLAHLLELRRLRSGTFRIEDCLSLEEIEKDVSRLKNHLKTGK